MSNLIASIISFWLGYSGIGSSISISIDSIGSGAIMTKKNWRHCWYQRYFSIAEYNGNSKYIECWKEEEEEEVAVLEGLKIAKDSLVTTTASS